MTAVERNRKLAQQLMDAHAAYLEAKSKYDELRDYFDKATGKETTQFGTMVVQYVPSTTSSTDWDAIKADYPTFNKERYTLKKATARFKGVQHV